MGIHRHRGFWESIVGVFSGICYANFPLVLAFLAGLGLGFLNNNLVLLPIFFLSIGFMIHSLNYNLKKHLSPNPIYLAIFSVVLLLGGIFFETVSLLIWAGSVGLITATIWDYKLFERKKRKFK